MKTINVQDTTYERFAAVIKKLVLSNGGQFVTQDEAMNEILDIYKKEVKHICQHT